jgi:hypothetical protein
MDVMIMIGTISSILFFFPVLCRLLSTRNSPRNECSFPIVCWAFYQIKASNQDEDHRPFTSMNKRITLILCSQLWIEYFKFLLWLKFDEKDNKFYIPTHIHLKKCSCLIVFIALGMLFYDQKIILFFD